MTTDITAEDLLKARQEMSEADRKHLDAMIDEEQRKRLSGSPAALQRLFPTLGGSNGRRTAKS